MKEVELNKDGYIQEVKEWTSYDISEFLSDFCSVSDKESIYQKAKDIFQYYVNLGYTEKESEFIAQGYERALLDIYNQM